MDRAIKAEWYDIDDAEREGFLAGCTGSICRRCKRSPVGRRPD